MLAAPTYEIAQALKFHSVVECGAGQGVWINFLQAAGVDIIGYDPRPGPGVLTGDHRDLAKHPDRLALIVWPPDDTNLNEWLTFFAGDLVAVCGREHRFTWPNATWMFTMETEGMKGTSQFRLGRLET